MPFAELKDIRVHYELSGSAGSPTLVLSNSLGTTFSMWDAQSAAFSQNMRVLRYDSRGHGQTSVTPGPYTIEQLGRDVLALVNSLKIDQFAFCGLSKGGMIGMWLGINAGERLTRLAVCNTGAKIGTLEGWNARIDAVRANGMKSISTAVVERWFTSRFREKEPDIIERTRKMVEATNPEGYAASCAAVRDADFRASIAAIRTPTLVVSGAHDPATPPSDGRFIAESIIGARYLELDAAHLSNIEAAQPFTTEVGAFLAN
jgi:3-oxoadipate enol-lactonase